MTSPSERIRTMVAEGRVGKEEGERLLRALAASAPASDAVTPSRARLLVDPFVRWGGGRAAVLGAFFVLLSLAISGLGVHYDGFLDLHVGTAVSPLPARVVEQIAAWPVGAALLWAVARVLVGPGRRFVDFLGAVGLARGPVVLLSLPVSALAPSIGAATQMSPALFLLIVIALITIAWQIALLFFGYRNASGLRGPRLGFSFAGALLAAEVVSKVVISLVKV